MNSYHDVYTSLVEFDKSRQVLIARDNQNVIAVLFGKTTEEMVNQLFDSIPNVRVMAENNDDKLRNIVTALLSDKTIYLPLSLKCGTPFQQKVWRAIQNIPRGSTITYTQLAEAIGQPKSCRAVASACAKNPIAILIPCHRVVSKNNGIGKYRWGSDLKLSLLAKEGAC